jgi:hypothetical protein
MGTINVSFTLQGISPILMHCGQTIDPLNPFSKAMKVNKKKNKTDEDLEVLSRLEWWAGLYLDKIPTINPDLSCTPKPGTKLIIPAHVIDSNIRKGAAKSKQGKLASAGCIVDGDGTFLHDGPTDLVELLNSGGYLARHNVRVGQASIIRTRAIFRNWGLKFSVILDPTVMDESTLKTAIENAGKLVGIGDWRPEKNGSFGRYILK